MFISSLPLPLEGASGALERFSEKSSREAALRTLRRDASVESSSTLAISMDTSVFDDAFASSRDDASYSLSLERSAAARSCSSHGASGRKTNWLSSSSLSDELEDAELELEHDEEEEDVRWALTLPAAAGTRGDLAQSWAPELDCRACPPSLFNTFASSMS
jgi:hypothetical protein